MTWTVLTHGGAGSPSAHRDGPQAAARAALAHLANGASALDAAVHAVTALEDDPRFNAGTGSNLRLDGTTLQMDAAVMTDDGRFGAVACIEAVRNPVVVARAVRETPHTLLVGEGATRFARTLGHAPYDPRTPERRAAHAKAQAFLAGERADAPYGAWDREMLRARWNFPTPVDEVAGHKDTVGAVVSDGTRFAAALSSGGTPMALLGRAGDVPLPGCGLFAGPLGAIAATGHGEAIARRVLAHQVYRWLEAGEDPEAACERALALFPSDEDVGLLVVGLGGHAAGSNRDMACAVVEG